MRSVRSVGVVACALLFWSCSMTKEHRDQTLGGVLGAVTGAAIGAAAGRGDPTAIVAGAVGGAVVGWGAVKLVQYYSQRTASAQETAKETGYTDSQGTLVKIRNARVLPGQVKPGERLTFETEYALMNPAKTGDIPVHESWELWKDAKLLTSVPPKTENREPGGWLARATVDSPAKASPGTYLVKNRIQAGESIDERTTEFIIT